MRYEATLKVVVEASDLLQATMRAQDVVLRSRYAPDVISIDVTRVVWGPDRSGYCDEVTDGGHSSSHGLDSR